MRTPLNVLRLLVLTAVAIGFLPFVIFAAPKIGDVLPIVSLEGAEGSRVSGESFSTQELRGRIAIIFYVDPDFATLNDPAATALKEANLSREAVNSTAIINMAATWIPNALIDGRLKEKQKEFPLTTYVRDLNSAFVKQWGLESDNSTVMVLGKSGDVLYYKAGKLSELEVKSLLALIRANIATK